MRHNHRGFGPPDYWVQLGEEGEWVPVRGNLRNARETAAIALADPALDFCLILRGTVPQGAIPQVSDIVEDVQREPVPGAQEAWVVGGRLRGMVQPADPETKAYRDSTLDPAVLQDAGVALSRDRTMIRDGDGVWYRMAWSYHENRYESNISHVDGILSRATKR